MATFFPPGDARLALWLENFSGQVAGIAASLGVSAADVKTMQKLCGNITSGINTANQKKKEWRAAAQAVKELRQTDLQTLSGMIAHLKTSPGWVGALGQTLGVVTSSAPAPNLDDYKPRLRAKTQAGRVELRFTRGRLDGVNVYVRKKGESSWRFVDRVRYSPAVDGTPVSAPGTPEVREYRIFGVYKDKEIGQPSDIVSMTVGD